MGCNVVPCGRSDLPGLDTVKLFCPNCNDIYVPASSRFQGVDGLSLPHRLRMSVSDRCLSVYRRLLWHYIRPSFLPDLSGAHASSILETSILIRFSFSLSITTQCNGKQLLSTSTIRQSQPTWWTKARSRKGVRATYLRIQGQREGEVWPKNAVDANTTGGPGGVGRGRLERTVVR